MASLNGVQFTKGNMEVFRCCAKDKMRYGLTSIFVESERTIASDGRKLAIVATPKDARETFIPFTISKDDAKNLAKSKLGLNLDVAETDLNGHAVFADGQGTRIAQKTDAHMPKFDDVVPPAGHGEVKIALDWRHLRALADVAKACGEDDGLDTDTRHTLILEIKDDRHAIRVTGNSARFVGVIMPIRIA